MKTEIKPAIVKTVPFNTFDASMGQTEKAGFILTLPEFPQIPVFIAKSERGVWYRFDPVTGLKFGNDERPKTRKAIITGTLEFLQRMLNAPKHKGSMASLLAFIGECQAYSLKNYLAYNAEKSA